MQTTGKRQRVRKVGSGLIPDKLYTTEGCMLEGGLGHESLAEARQSGIVKPVLAGRRLYYRGEELIQWILSHGK